MKFLWTMVLGLCIALLATGFTGSTESAAAVVVRVTGMADGQPLPCRITVLDERGALANLTITKAPTIAYRPGVIYTATGDATFIAAPGRYTVCISRGLEYGLAVRQIAVGERPVNLEIKLEREVDTRGYIAADTHIHTLTHSGHGDATMDERMATIAGEGIELAVATDHNHHTDYRPAMRTTGTSKAFTPVIGNEVTTSAGHFNAFPILAGSAVPDFRSTDWKQMLRGIRAVPGVKVVVLNHPSNVHSGFKPTDSSRFHSHSGEALDGRDWDFDGIEIVTSAALQSDVMKPVRDWFALLNAGRKITGIGSSDTHEVNAYILGQGRTYIASKAISADTIDVNEACENLKSGKALVSMGLLTEAWVEGSTGVGETAGKLNADMRVRVRVQAPRWIHADKLELYLNGLRILSRPISSPEPAVIKLDSTVSIRRPKHDSWLVAVATGPGIDGPYWPIPRPYQPLNPNWEPRVIGVTNPIWLDEDNDGKNSSPAEYARKVLDSADGELSKTLALLKKYDESVSVQAAALMRSRGVDFNSGSARAVIDGASPPVRHAFVAYQNALPTSK